MDVLPLQFEVDSNWKLFIFDFFIFEASNGKFPNKKKSKSGFDSHR